MSLDKKREYSKEELDNHANQLNENNDAYWKARGEEDATDQKS